MADFKLLGNTDPDAVNLAGVMTQGIGFPLRDVDTAATTVDTITVLDAASFSLQNPVGLDNPLQVEFGAPQSTPEFDIDALGNITCNADDEYSLRLRLEMGRSGNPGVAILFARALVNGTQIGRTVYSKLDDGDDAIPATFTGAISLSQGDVLTFEIYRDSAGINEGGLYPQVATLAGWTDAPSSQILIEVVKAGPPAIGVTTFSL